MAEAAVVDEVLHRAIERNEHVEVRKRSQERTPHQRLAADLGTEDRLSYGRTDGQLGQRIRGNVPPSWIDCRV